MLLVSLQAHWPLLSHLYCCFLLPAQPLAARKPWTFLSSTIAPSFSEFMTTHMSQCPPQICPPAQSSLLNSRLMPSLLHVTSRRFSLLVPKAASLPSPVSCLLVTVLLSRKSWTSFSHASHPKLVNLVNSTLHNTSRIRPLFFLPFLVPSLRHQLLCIPFLCFLVH